MTQHVTNEAQTQSHFKNTFQGTTPVTQVAVNKLLENTKALLAGHRVCPTLTMP